MCRKIYVADRRRVEIFQPNKYANASLYAYDCNLTSAAAVTLFLCITVMHVY